MHYFILLSTRADSSGHCHPVSRRAPCMISPSCWYQVTRFIHHNSLIMWWELNRKKWLLHLRLTSSTRMNNAECSIHHLASSCISSSREVALLLPRKRPVSVSLVDSVWRNLRDSIVLESIFSSKKQFAPSKLSINRDTWTTHRSAHRYKEKGF